MSAIDKGKLLTWLGDRSNRTAAVVGAVYAGLVTRIERGEFDEESGSDE